MTNTRVLSNTRISVFLGPDSAIANYAAPLLSELATLTNVSEAIRWSGFAFNLKASSSEVDTSLTDQAGAKSRGYTQFGGAIAFFTPKPSDTTSILRVARNIVKTPHTRLAVVVRTITLNTAGIAVGDELNAYRTITDANAHEQGKASFAYTIDFSPVDDNGLNYIVPAATAVAATVTPSAAISGLASAGILTFLTAAYQGRNVTVGATWVSSNPLVATVSAHGVVHPLIAGTSNITAQAAGGLISTAVVGTWT